MEPKNGPSGEARAANAAAATTTEVGALFKSFQTAATTVTQLYRGTSVARLAAASRIAVLAG